MKRFDFNEVVVGFLLLFIGILIGSFWFSDIVESFVKGAATLGSLATAATLIVLIIQNIQIRKNQASQDDRIQKNDNKQHQMWDEQKMMLSFQKYQMHQKSFNDLLDDLENTHQNLNIKFYERPDLYKKLFPKNNVNSLDFHSSQIDEISKGCINLLVSELEYFSENNTHKVIDTFLNIFKRIHMSFSCNSTIGDISNMGSRTGFNVFCYSNLVFAYFDIIIALYSFSNIKNNTFCANSSSFPWLGEYEISTIINYSINNGDIDLGKIDPVLFKCLWTMNSNLKLSKGYKTKSTHQKTLGSNSLAFLCKFHIGLFGLDKLYQLENDETFKVEVIKEFINAVETEIEKGKGNKFDNIFLKNIALLNTYINDVCSSDNTELPS
ncbi:MAG: hypothetical protein JKY55_13585 [Aliivibrio sp.]|uniref:hypothetical protein n=1 Tax=Aliivibrio sp. TaxID=1872443 RepID=UPI001A443945|nr:hypothetical protein [Aliivibrio sp.]